MMGNAELAVQKPGARELLGRKSFVTLMISNAISRFGDSVDMIALGWMVYTLTGSKLLMGSLFAVNFIPNLIFGVFSGVLADRFPKQRLAIIGNLGRGIIVCLVALLYMTELLRPWHLFVFTFLTSMFEVVSSPAERAMLPLTVPKHLYLSANSLFSSVTNFFQFMGAAAAGFIIGVAGIPGAMLIDGLTFFTVCILMLFIRLEEGQGDQERLSGRAYIKNLKEGFGFLTQNRFLIWIALCSAFINLCLTPYNVLEAAYVKDILKAGAEGMSYLSAGFFAGMILGGVAAAALASKIKKSRMISGGVIGMGVCYALLSLPGQVESFPLSPVLMAALTCFFFGFFIPICSAPLNSHIMEKTPKELMGRVLSILTMFGLCAIPLGSALTGIVAEYVAIPKLFMIMGFAVMALAFFQLLNKEFRKI